MDAAVHPKALAWCKAEGIGDVSAIKEAESEDQFVDALGIAGTMAEKLIRKRLSQM